MDFDTFTKELRSNRDEDRRERKDDREKLHGRIDDLGKSTVDLTQTVGDLGTTVAKMDVSVGIHHQEIERLRNKRSSRPPDSPHSMRHAAAEKVSATSWTKIGTAIGAVVAALGIPTYAVSSSVSAQTTAIEKVEAQQVVVEERAVVSEADQIELLQAQLAATKANALSAKAINQLDEVADNAAQKQATKAEADLARVMESLEKRRAKVAQAPAVAP